ncbi:DUF4139 domain-containing protein [candidate division GN15 bacterium]|uniref:DUF4139 domain-containing protein n=1 Tax=candidate division GN15 bacterium TaxID=2072418 RepID=A0A855X5X5_9BACT|nr:MAG: DUF4139 domain-containing protein [candidate division GN15 bacterium]
MQKRALVVLILALVSSAVAADLAVTVYNSNLGVISETRQLDFKKGVNTLAFRDVPALIDAASVRFDLLNSGRNVSILEQNYAYDLVNPDQMYRKYIDQEIELIDKDGKLYSGTLLAYSQGAVTLQDKAGKVLIVLLANISQVTFPALPDGLITRPTLFWRYQSDADGKLDSRVSYQTGGMNWTAEYVGVLDKTETKLDLSGWASIDNESGKRYENATLRLVAGDISRVQRPTEFEYAPKADMLMRAGAAPGFQEKAFFEYHLYTLPRTATLADKEMKQISLFEPSRATVQKEFVFAPEENSSKVKVAIKFKNSQQAGLGMPLPEGRVRMFKADDDGSLILLGEDQIDHTPKDEELDIKVGYAFDISAEERLANQRQISSRVEERDYEVEIRNHKSEPVTVKVDKKLWGFWEVVKAGFEYRKKDAYTLQFNVPVAANDTAIARYTVRFTSQ